MNHRLARAVPIVAALAVCANAHATTKRATKHRARPHHAVARERAVPWLKGNQPNVLAHNAFVVDIDNGHELFARHADQEHPIASISKLAAMLVALDHNLDLDGLTTVTKVDAQVARGGAPSRLLEGMTLSNRDLLHAAMLGSDNRAVSALGRAVGLNAVAFAREMTKKAQELNLPHTRFREPTGLSPENVSTPREVVELLKAAMKQPVLGPIVRRVEYDAHPVSRPAIKYISTHRPAARANAQVLGGKTGYNDFARYCLVLAARIDGHTYAMAFLGDEGKMTRFGDFARVADWIVVRKPKGGAASGAPLYAGTAATPPGTDANPPAGAFASGARAAFTPTPPGTTTKPSGGSAPVPLPTTPEAPETPPSAPTNAVPSPATAAAPAPTPRLAPSEGNSI